VCLSIPQLQTDTWQNPSTAGSTKTVQTSTTVTQKPEGRIGSSSLSLLEHVNINVPNHRYILPFYLDLLGCGLDPRRAQNVVKGSKTVWANCGASQFHLPYDEVPQVVPGHMGLRYDSLEGLKDRIRLEDTKEDKCFQEYAILIEDGKEVVRIVDQYGNVFYCRSSDGSEQRESMRQPIISKDEVDTYGEEVASHYGRDASECRGLDYVEFDCPIGSAPKIAAFYESVLGASTHVATESSSTNKDEAPSVVARVAFGKVVVENDDDSSFLTQQELVFRETQRPIPPYDGHHVAMYVGHSQADFEKAFSSAHETGIVWVNPRFSDKTTDLDSAREYRQFRFKDIVDPSTGQVIFQLEHEMRSVQHTAWPGKNSDKK